MPVGIVVLYGTKVCKVTVLTYLEVSADSLSRGGDVAVYVIDINQPNLPTPFYYVVMSISVFMAPVSYTHLTLPTNAEV